MVGQLRDLVMGKTTLDYAKELQLTYERLEEFQATLAHDFGYKVQSVLKNYRSLFERFCPYKVGDRVMLTKTPNIKPGSGWHGSRHFLIEGAIAVVESCDYREGKFVFSLHFDDESWIDRDGTLRPVTHKCSFAFSEDWLCRYEQK